MTPQQINEIAGLTHLSPQEIADNSGQLVSFLLARKVKFAIIQEAVKISQSNPHPPIHPSVPAVKPTPLVPAPEKEIMINPFFTGM